MGRRYRNSMMHKKEIITYHVYEDGVLKESFRANKEAALDYASNLTGETQIKKTREITTR